MVVLEEAPVELPLAAGELAEVAGLELVAGLDDVPPDFEAAGLEVVDDFPVAGDVADDVAAVAVGTGVVIPGVVVAVALGDAVAVAVAVAVGDAVAVAVAVGDAVAVGVAVAIGVAVAVAAGVTEVAGVAVGAVCPAIPDCVVTPVRPPPPRLMLIPAAGCTP